MEQRPSKDDPPALNQDSYLATRQSYVQRFTLIYCSTTLAFSAYFTPQDFNLKTAVIINILLFLIGAPYWFRKSRIPDMALNLTSQLSNVLASIWICSFLGPTSHINLVAIPQFVLVLMMFQGKSRILTFALGAMCVFQLSLPLFPMVDIWYLDKRMKEENLVILREILDLSILMLTIYQFRVISESWRDSLTVMKKEKEKLATESAWRFRLLRILSHDIKEPMVSALQLLRKLRRGSDQQPDPRIINQLENSQMMIREIISNVESYASAHEEISLPSSLLSCHEVLDKLTPWLKSRLEDKGISIDTRSTHPGHKLRVNPESFVYQVFLNLLSNAVKFSPKGAVIEIETRMDDRSKVVWTIRDHGKGIAPDALTRETFSEPGTSGESGSGLGIRIAVLLAKKQGIELGWTALTEPAPGTVVSIRERT
ncbi:MAG: sensor histidine kinase [Proteobacteria bacterium]|nr:sensor histidine kinase [Pseudomonadota bacterium]